MHLPSRREIKAPRCTDLSCTFYRSSLSASFGTPSQSLKPVRTAIYICYGPVQAVRTTGTLLQFMAAPTLFARLNHARHSAPAPKRSPPDTFKSRTPDATRKLQPVVSSIATPVNLIVIEVLVIVPSGRTG